MQLLNQYHLYLMGAVFVGFFFLPEEYTREIVVCFLVVLLGISIAFELFLGEPVTRLPALVNRTVNRSTVDDGKMFNFHKTVLHQVTPEGMHIPDEMVDELMEPEDLEGNCPAGYYPDGRCI